MNARQQSILIVDDDDQFRISLCKIFSKIGYKVSVASDAGEALEILSSSFYDLVVVDYRLPGMSGLKLINEIKSTSPKSKIMIVTAYGDATIRKQALKTGAFAFLDKPVRRKHLLDWAMKALMPE